MMHYLKVAIACHCMIMLPTAALSLVGRRAFQRSVCSFRCAPHTHLRTVAGNTQYDGDDDGMNHRKFYSITGTGQRSKVIIETNTGHTLETDVPKKMGGSDSAPQPVEHLLAALLGCTQATAIYVGRMMTPRLLIDRIDFDIEAHRDERGALELPIDKVPAIPARLQSVSGTVTVHFKKGFEDISDKQLRTLGEQTEARCPVANMMHASGCVMDIEWVNGSKLEK